MIMEPVNVAVGSPSTQEGSRQSVWGLQERGRKWGSSSVVTCFSVRWEERLPLHLTHPLICLISPWAGDWAVPALLGL